MGLSFCWEKTYAVEQPAQTDQIQNPPFGLLIFTTIGLAKTCVFMHG